MLAGFLIVLAELKFFAGSKILLLYVGDVAHDACFGGNAGHVGALAFGHIKTKRVGETRGIIDWDDKNANLFANKACYRYSARMYLVL